MACPCDLSLVDVAAVQPLLTWESLPLGSCSTLDALTLSIPIYQAPYEEIRDLRSAVFLMLDAVHPGIGRLQLKFGATLATVVNPYCVFSSQDWKCLDTALPRFTHLRSLELIFHTFIAGGHFENESVHVPERWYSWVKDKLPSMNGMS